MRPDPQLTTAPPALAGVRVLDLTHRFAGGLAGRLLAEAGASVTRVETARARAAADVAPVTMAVVRRSRVGHLNLDVERDSGRLDELVGASDIVLHEFSPSEREAEIIQEISTRHPSVVVGRCPAYPNGFESDLLSSPSPDGAELLVQARLGLLDEQESVAGGPMMQRMPVCGVSAAYLLAAGVLAQLVRRIETGTGGTITTSLLQGGLLSAALYWQRPEIVPDNLNTQTLRKHDTPTGLTIFPCADGEWLQVMGAFTNSLTVRQVLTSVGAIHLQGRDVTPDNVGEWRTVFAARTRDEWLDNLWAEDVPCMPSLRRGELLGVPQARVTGSAVDVDEPPFARSVQNGSPFDIEWAPAGPPPQQGTAHPSPRGRGPLAGVRVLDFGMFVSAPFAAQCLADLGAQVTKVEPVGGDRGRIITQFLACQRGKRSLALDLKNPRATEVVGPLVAASDIVIHNFRDKAARTLGLDWATLRAANPAVVVGHVSGYGRTGPWSHLPGYDPTAQALSGWEHGIVPEGARPRYMRNSIMDSHAGCALTVGLLSALYRSRTVGGSASVHTSLLGVAALSDCSSLIAADGTTVRELPILPDESGVAWYYRIYQASDGSVAVAAVTANQQAALLTSFAVSRPEDLPERIAGRSTAEILERLRRVEVPAEAVVLDNQAAFFARELATGSGLIRRTASREFGVIEQVGSYWSSTDGRPADGRVPAIGEHSREILHELAVPEPLVAELEAAGAVRR